uniref:hypothetical protein n=1 Tax=Mesomycoplasma ovipneumoniae TaxID=29562 RepID=UPI00308007B4
VLPRINKFPKNISKVFWSAPSVEWTTNDGHLNDIFYLNRAIPTLSGNQGLSINTGLPSGGTQYRCGTWTILYVKNKEGSKDKPDLSKVNLTFNSGQQNFNAPQFENQQ